MGRVHSEAFFEILAQCESLVSCAIDLNLASIPSTSPILRPSLILQHLQRLSITAAPGKDDSVCQILDHLTTLSLVHLSYKRKGGGTERDDYSSLSMASEKRVAHSLGDFFSRMSRPLEELDFLFEPASEELIFDILKCTPGLKRLSLRGKVSTWSQHSVGSRRCGRSWLRKPFYTAPMCDSLLSRFIPADSRIDSAALHSICTKALVPTSIFLCPNLEVLSLSEVDFSHDTLLNLMRCRSVDHHKRGVAHLRKVSLHFTPSYPGRLGDMKEIKLQQQLMELGKATGLQVFLHYPPVPEIRPVALPSFKPDWPYSGVQFIDDTFMYIPNF
jgi:hypothetical protein